MQPLLWEHYCCTCNPLVSLALITLVGLYEFAAYKTPWLTVFLLLPQKYSGDLLLLVLDIGGRECCERRESLCSWGDLLLLLWSSPYSPGNFWQINRGKERISWVGSATVCPQGTIRIGAQEAFLQHECCVDTDSTKIYRSPHILEIQSVFASYFDARYYPLK